MSAKHSGSMGTSQKSTLQSAKAASYELSKQSNLQMTQPPSTFFSMKGNGQNPNAGTTWPQPIPFAFATPAAVVNIDLSKTFGTYTCISLTEDDTVVNLKNLIQNRSLDFYLDITINTATFNSITFNPTIQNLPTLPTENGDRYLLNIMANKTDTVETFFVVGGTLSIENGGGGISFPIDFPELDMNNPTVSTTIDYALASRHFRAIELSDDLIVNLANIPPGEGALCIIYFTQDGLGGHTPSLPDIVNQNEITNNIDLTPGATTIFTVMSAFGTTLGFATGKNVFFGSSGEDWSTFDAIQSVNMNENSINNALGLSFLSIFGINSSLAPTVEGLNILSGVGRSILLTEDGLTNFAKFDSTGTDFFQKEIRGITGIDMDGVSAIIEGVANVNFIQTAQEIDSFATHLFYQVDTGQFHQHAVGGVPKFEVRETFIKSFVALNMNNQEVNLVSDIAFGTAILLNTAENAIGFSSLHGLQHNTNDTSEPHSFTSEGELLATISRVGSNQGQIQTHAVIGNILQANEHLFLSPTTDPVSLADGQYWYNASENAFKFRQDGVTVGLGGPTISAGDSFVTVIDTGTGSVITHVDGVQKYSIQATRADYDEIPIFGMTQLNLHESGGAASASIKAFSATVMDIEFAGVPLARFESTFLQLLSGNPNTSEVVLNMYRNDASATDDDVISRIRFQGNNDAVSPVIHDYVELRTEIISKVDGAETGDFIVNVLDEGVKVDMFRVVSGEAVLRKLTTSPTDGALLRLIKEDATPVADDFISAIDHSILDAGVETVYAQTRSEIDDVTDTGKWFASVRADNTGLIDALEIIGHQTAAITFININSRLLSDLTFDTSGGTVNFGGSQSGVGAAGFADDVPTKPDHWVKIKISGIEFVIPAFAVS